jgi:hypothetical protein
VATRRYRQGLAHYSPKRTAAARHRKRVEGPKQKAKRERAAAAKGRLPAPKSKAAARILDRFLPDTEEVRWLKRASLTEITAPGFRGGSEWGAELNKIAGKRYRAAYAAQRKARGAGKPRKLSEWIRVKAHKRRRPRRR